MNFKLSTALLFILSIQFIMSVRISPEETPYWLFGIIFACLFGYAVADLLKITEKLHFRIKSIILWIVIALTIGAAFYSVIIVRHKVAPVYTVHDIVLQQEAAIRFLLDGKNPYSTPYFGTPLESFNFSDTDVNPALYYFVMEPFYLLFPIPFYVAMVHSVGFFDVRVPLYLLFFATLFIVWKVVKEKEEKLIAITLIAFNPAQLYYTLEGRSDAFLFAFFVAFLFFLSKKKIFLASILLGLAFCIKQSVWPIFPLYFIYLYKTEDIKTIISKALIPFGLVVVSFMGPFFLWNPKSFIDSTVGYLSGSVEHAYPISGYGFSMILKSWGFIKTVHDYYPFIIWQAIFAIPALFFTGKYLIKNPSVKALIITYTLLLFVFWYFSRYFNNSHAGYIATLMLLAYVWPYEKVKK